MYDDKIIVGATVASWCECFDPSAGAVFDPTEITVTWKAPDGTDTVYIKSDLERQEEGVFRSRHTCNQVGNWWVTWEVDGQAKGKRQWMVHVSPAFTP